MTVTVCNRQRFRRVDSRQVRTIALQTLTKLDSPVHDLNIVIVNDRQIAELNRQFHQTDGATDVLSFDYGGGQGELIVSVERACAQARQFRSTASRELALYVIHGILHLSGYDDLAPRPRVRMRVAERRLLVATEFRGLVRPV